MEIVGHKGSESIRIQLVMVKIQFFPAIHIDPQGGINIIYLDDRNTTSDSSGIFLSRSTNGGDTWTDYEISDHNFGPTAVSGIGAGNISDHIDITYTLMESYGLSGWITLPEFTKSGLHQ
jgi:hypothetical protein